MPGILIESVPNFSEGNDNTTIAAIVAAIGSVAGAHVLAWESDRDHNRTVVTVAGRPEPVQEAVFRGVACAVERIDLRRHQGVHPRIGAADVVPLIPIEGASLEDCAAWAHQLGDRIAAELAVPVYFYEAAALRPDRRRLENVRRGGFELLREAALTDPDREPDRGRRQLHPTAGAVAVGARKYLLAFNINLQTADVEVARAIARKIRASSGGLPHVKAMGVLLASRNLAQVSMNLTDFEVTPLDVVFEAVRAEAARMGVAIAGSEIIGLMPARALESRLLPDLLD
jgi:glutamate formiminotransferase